MDFVATLLNRVDDHIFSTIDHARIPTAIERLIDWWRGDSRARDCRLRLEQLRSLACEFERLNAIEAEVGEKVATSGPHARGAWERRERLVGKLRDSRLADLVTEAKKGARF